jgi:predicted transcriptional regulator
MNAMKTDQTKPNPELAAYEAWYDEQVRLGLEDIKAGRVVTDEQAQKHWGRLLKKLEKKHGLKAA